MALTQRIEALKQRHAHIDDIVHAEEVRPNPDIVRLHELKRQKLSLKDELARLLSEGTAAA